MNVLPSCSHYIRRTLKRALKTTPIDIPDLLQPYRSDHSTLEDRLHDLYPDSCGYKNVVLHLEQLTYSHQQAHMHRQQEALQDISNRMLWWLGYGIGISSYHLPSYHLPSHHSSKHHSNYPTHNRPPHIFIVDDTLETLKLVTAILSMQGYQVDSALSGPLALAAIRTSPPDLILLDINLPNMDGYQVYEHLQTTPQTVKIPVIFLSGVDTIPPTQFQIEKAKYIQKPFQPDDLLQQIEAHLSHSLLESTSMSQSKNDNKAEGNDSSDSSDSNHDTTNYDTTNYDIELKHRRHQALELLTPKNSGLSCSNLNNAIDLPYFFRATLDGRYLRIGQALVQLFGYQSAEEMMSQVTNLWHQVYATKTHQKKWSVCRQCPNQVKTLSAQIKTQQGSILDVVENICVVQDQYNRPLLYQGHIQVGTMLK